MKKLLILLPFLLLAFATRAQQHLKQYIVHISPTSVADKSAEELTINWGDPRVVTQSARVVATTDSASMKSLLNFITKNNSRHKTASNAFGSYEVVVYNQIDLVTAYYLTSRAETQKYLETLATKLTSDKADGQLTDELKKLSQKVAEPLQ